MLQRAALQLDGRKLPALGGCAAAIFPGGSAPGNALATDADEAADEVRLVVFRGPTSPAERNLINVLFNCTHSRLMFP